MSEYLELKDLPKDYISYSQINMYKRCPMQYRIRYVENKKAPPPGAIVAGQATHEALEYDLAQKITTKENLKTKEVLEIFSDSFERICSETKELTGEAPVFDKEPKEKVKDTTVKGIELYHMKEAVLLEPTAVEKKFLIEFKNVSYKIIGSIDTIHKDTLIIDFKTTKRYNKSILPPDQLKMYSLTIPKAEYRLDTIDCIEKPKIYKDLYTINTQTQKKYLQEINTIITAIKAELFYPNPGLNYMTCNMCGFGPKGKKWCELWK